MVDGLRQLARQSREATENLNASAAEIRASTQEQAASVEEQLAAVQETAATVDEITHAGAQIGKRVHISAAAQIGGVLEPVGQVPVIIEDDVIVGGNYGIYEGTIVRPRAVIGAGVVLTGSTPVYDTVRGQVYRRTPERPLEIPFGAVVIPGSRPMKGAFAEQHGLHIASPVIVKYRDDKTDAATALEEALR